MKKFILFLIVTASISSCSKEYIEKQEKAEFERDAKKCESYGAKRNTDPFVQCMATLESGHQSAYVIDNSLPTAIRPVITNY